jgi:pantoate--beta-alanine ligase
VTLPLIRTKNEAREFVTQALAAGRRLAVVPTMGALHRGHQALIACAAEQGDEVVVTLFVNPTQFGPGEDFEKYPRTLEQDLARAAEAGATQVFFPHPQEMYPPGEQTRVHPGAMANGLCGASRPGHFSGVLTVVAKFMNLFSPAVFVFGRKDFQQLRLIERMVIDLSFNVSIVEHPIVRQSDGLALSSRNAYLSAEERSRALSIPRALLLASELFSEGEPPCRVEAEVSDLIEQSGLRIDYVELVTSDTLERLPPEEWATSPLLAVAAFCGPTRLIDNLRLGVDLPPVVVASGDL